MNIGEELVSDYLQYIKRCEFVQKNLYTEDVQGEIDVVGINLKTRTVYICEVAIHLVTGLQYVHNKQPNNVNKLTDKFSKDIEYARKYFPTKDGYKHQFMLWSPIVKDKSNKAKHNQLSDVIAVQQEIKKKYKEDIEAVINEEFLNRLAELKQYAIKETKEIKSAVVRFYQIEDKTNKYINSKTYKNQKAKKPNR
ncbi:MAG: hypothetical protein RBT56_14015 [Ignavibacteriaceae bacterium]|jgi:hypothetical protein|nr:hypothetical protein [Ignavibacteriaceae bacterium]GIK21363.1 MAG: hypothetical protein BroJett005_07770 [Ignavibacteriota bacterium]